MRRTLVTMTGLLLMAGCGGSPEAVGENSTGSIRTTAVGNVVAPEPSPTPSPTAGAMNAADAAVDDAADAMDNAM